MMTPICRGKDITMVRKDESFVRCWRLVMALLALMSLLELVHIALLMGFSVTIVEAPTEVLRLKITTFDRGA